jgi:hypothetical protein
MLLPEDALDTDEEDDPDEARLELCDVSGEGAEEPRLVDGREERMPQQQKKKKGRGRNSGSPVQDGMGYFD